ncbi:MAG: ribonuclease III domain-containing protein [Oscillospiraceae bacterium]
MLFNSNSKIDIKEQSPISLAFVGDGVMELLVRQREVETTRLTPAKLQTLCVKFVSAKGQFIGLSAIENILTENEQNILRRGKNASKASVSKHATPEEYRASTGIEALFGYLYLQNQNERIEELFEVFWQAVAQTL